MATQMLARWRAGRRRCSRIPTPRPSSVRLAIEQLETRMCPSPVVNSFQATARAGGQVELTGSVSDSASGSLNVTFNGSGVSTSTTLAASGSFDIFASASSLGNVTAVAQNTATQAASAPLTSSIQDPGPVISNFTASQVSGCAWTFSGQVTDGSMSVTGLTVHLGGFAGLNGVTATVNSQGWFTVTVMLPPGTSGTATAQTEDSWGVWSNVAWTIVN
jgi:hypothetical protein